MLEQLVIEGIAIGACYGLFGVAVAIIYKTSEVVNFAQGEMGMVATFVAYHILVQYQLPFWAAFILTAAFAVVLGCLIEFLFLKPARDPSVLGLIIITLGVEMLLMGLASWKWGAEQKDFAFPLSVQRMVEPLPGLVISEWSLGVFTLTPLIMILLFLFFRYSRLGIAMRATQQNVNAARIMGIKVERVFAFTWALSSLIGTVAAMFFAARGVLDPNFMMEPFLRAFAAAVLGGLTSIPGVVAGGLLLGLIENFFGYAWPQWKPIVAFVIIIGILTIRPSGLFARHYLKKV